MAMFAFLFTTIGALAACGAVYAITVINNRKKSGWYEGRI